MIRIIIDRLGSGSKDMFLKIDAVPNYSKNADSYYLFDFLEIKDDRFTKLNLKDAQVLKYVAIELLKYWKERISNIKKEKQTFLPFDISDEYVGGLLLEKSKLGFIVKIVFTDQIHGYGINKSNIERQLIDKNIEFIFDGEKSWLIGEEAIINGLDWSLNELEK